MSFIQSSQKPFTIGVRRSSRQEGPAKKDKDKGRGQKPYDRSNRNRNQNQSGSQNSNQNRSKGKGGKGKGKGKGKSQNPQSCNRCGRVGHIEKDCYSTKTPDGKEIKGKPPAKSPFQNRRQQQQNQGAKDGSGKLINTINTLVKELKNQHSINAAVATPVPASAPAPQGNSQGTAQWDWLEEANYHAHPIFPRLHLRWASISKDAEDFYIIDMKPFTVILGQDWLERRNPHIDFQTKNLTITRKHSSGSSIRTVLSRVEQTPGSDDLPEMELVSATTMRKHLRRIRSSGSAEEAVAYLFFLSEVDGELVFTASDTDTIMEDPEVTAARDQMREDCSDIFQEDLPAGHRPERFEGGYHRINIEPGHKPPSQPVRTIPMVPMMEELKRQIIKYVDLGILRASVIISIWMSYHFRS
ncbi:hypothetical protein CYMTET_47524 [Cymbomonas tetramitiformis]|uniref:CCHC-type domain-containing protein n=1 Tax=Cymbomonas tetramitiformis TaxID=36881 RepID=A0AAE0BW09_9CHLO|nr:hypothetical protein CYMTET_47524 [Cymbomonas tetramitiformis]